MRQIDQQKPRAWYSPLVRGAGVNTCIAYVGPGQPCPGRPIAYVVASCAHDHLREGMHCDRHLFTVTTSSCRACALGVELTPHDCPLSVLEVQHRRA